MRSVLLISAILLFCNVLNAQQNSCDIKNKKAEKLIYESQKAYRNRNLQLSVKYLKEAIKEEPDFVKAHFLLGHRYFEEGDFQKAQIYYKKCIELCPDLDPYAYFELGKAAYYLSDYDSCQKYLDIYLLQEKKDEKALGEADTLLTKCAFLEYSLANPVPYDPSPVDGVCTGYDEYLPIISPDNELFFFIRSEPVKRKSSYGGTTVREDFSCSESDSIGHFNRGKPLPPPFNMGSNEGGGSITIDNKEMFLTICNRPDGMGSCDIYYTHIVDGYWAAPINMNELTDSVNTVGWESQVSISSDGKTLYFASYREEGYGGYDIYKVEKDSIGNWSLPINAGPVINTSKHEKSPFIHIDNQTLYFSSQGHLGLGGYDIFISRKDTIGRWTTPMNIGYPINSVSDDLGFFVSTNGEKGYFASNKLKGIGGWDIYGFDLYEGARPKRVLFLKGEIKDKWDDPITDAKVQLKDLKTNEVTEIPVDTVTGTYVYTEVFESSKMMTVKKKGFIYHSEFIDVEDTTDTKPKTIDIDLETVEKGASFTIDRPDHNMDHLLFDTDSYELKEHAMAELENLVQFLEDNVTVKIAVYGHTDNVGDGQQNQLLSENRAMTVYNYLIQKGIQKYRLSYKGFGESKPIATNQTESGRALNRRTEIVILSK